MFNQDDCDLEEPFQPYGQIVEHFKDLILVLKMLHVMKIAETVIDEPARYVKFFTELKIDPKL